MENKIDIYINYDTGKAIIFEKFKNGWAYALTKPFING